MVKELNMASLVHQGSKSLTARILGRVKGNIEVFVAPVASFALNCLPPLSKCNNLKALDLSLVSESPPLHNLFKTTAHLEKLVSFRLPRSSGFGGQIKKSEQLSQHWPPKLRDLSLSGGIDGLFLHGVVGLPEALQKLTIEHCPLIRTFEMDNLLQRAVISLPQLTDVTIRHLPRLSGNALDHLLLLLPQLRRLSISVDYISPAFFDFGTYAVFRSLATDEKPRHYNLYHLELTTSSSTNIEDKIAPVDVAFAMDEGLLPALRQVRVSKALLWHSIDTKSDVEDLASTLQEASRKDWEVREGVFARMNERDYAKVVDGQAAWERMAGVWMFDDNVR
nr:f-box protein [Quercus suber]